MQGVGCRVHGICVCLSPPLSLTVRRWAVDVHTIDPALASILLGTLRALRLGALLERLEEHPEQVLLESICFGVSC